MDGQDHRDAYRSISFEQRAYDVSDNYLDVSVPGLLGGDTPGASFPMKTRSAAARERADKRARARAVVAAGIAAVTLTACQDGLDIGVWNKCGTPVTVNLAGIDEPPDYAWHELDASERGYVVTIPINRDLVHVWVGVLEEAREISFSVPVDELTTLPDDYRDDYDLELTLERDRCPAL